MKESEIPTPALLLDRSAFESNLQHMADFLRSAGKYLRPHAKAHKCVEIARRQIAAGAIGVCAATVPEIEMLVAGGVDGILLTSPLADPGKMSRVAELAKQDQGLTVVVDHERQVTLWDAAAAGAGVRLRVLVDIDCGDHRTGIAPGAPALALARRVADSGSLAFEGVQAYSVKGSHVEGWEERQRFAADAWREPLATVAAMREDGLAVNVVSGGSTGTYEVEAALDAVTEVQAGSYVLLDMDYQRIGVNFEPALSVLTTVISANHPTRATVDVGTKALATDRGYPPKVWGPEGITYAFAGDEFGTLHFEGHKNWYGLGDKVHLAPPHCDPTVNLYDRIYVCADDEVIAVWPCGA